MFIEKKRCFGVILFEKLTNVVLFFPFKCGCLSFGLVMTFMVVGQKKDEGKGITKVGITSSTDSSSY